MSALFPSMVAIELPYRDRRSASSRLDQVAELRRSTMPTIYIDADACPVKAEVYRVAKRHGLLTLVVANQWMDMPNDPMVRIEVVDDGFDAADHWIVEHVVAGDVVVSDDIPLAARCLEKGAKVITNRGDIRNDGNIGEAIAQRQLMSYLRGAGDARGGAKPMQESDRREFMRVFERVVVSAGG
jgi:uncharacterized protein